MDNELSVNIDFSAAKSWDFSDIIQIQNRRISAFPDFLMGWVTRQVEEIVVKLTDFPTVFIILPDFSGVLDFGTNTEDEIWDFIETDEIDLRNGFKLNAWIQLRGLPIEKSKQEYINIVKNL